MYHVHSTSRELHREENRSEMEMEAAKNNDYRKRMMTCSKYIWKNASFDSQWWTVDVNRRCPEQFSMYIYVFFHLYLVPVRSMNECQYTVIFACFRLSVPVKNYFEPLWLLWTIKEQIISTCSLSCLIYTTVVKFVTHMYADNLSRHVSVFQNRDADIRGDKIVQSSGSS